MESTIQSESQTTSRRRPRESETESQKIKREKAAERQRRKRERDRKNAAALQHQAAVAAQQQQQLQQPPQIQQPPQQLQQPQPQQEFTPQELTPEEVQRRDRVRAAARERQRKHRHLVKQRRMRELGLDMGNDIMPGMEEVHYRAAADGQYHQVLSPELQQQLQQAAHQPMPPHEPPFPQGPPVGGQTFASTLLLSFSCAPLLKQHLLRTLAMSNEELASLEPIIAEAWDRWDHQRRVHYAEQVAKNGGPPQGMPPPYGVEIAHDPQAAPPTLPYPHPNGPGPADPNQAGSDFRARFHRSMIVPTPFRAAFADNQTASTATASSTSGSAPAEVIDPHLATNGNSNASTATKS